MVRSYRTILNLNRAFMQCLEREVVNYAISHYKLVKYWIHTEKFITDKSEGQERSRKGRKRREESYGEEAGILRKTLDISVMFYASRNTKQT
jgi:hypothetical protein